MLIGNARKYWKKKNNQPPKSHFAVLEAEKCIILLYYGLQTP